MDRGLYLTSVCSGGREVITMSVWKYLRLYKRLFGGRDPSSLGTNSSDRRDRRRRLTGVLQSGTEDSSNRESRRPGITVSGTEVGKRTIILQRCVRQRSKSDSGDGKVTERVVKSRRVDIYPWKPQSQDEWMWYLSTLTRRRPSRQIWYFSL